MRALLPARKVGRRLAALRDVGHMLAGGFGDLVRVTADHPQLLARTHLRGGAGQSMNGTISR